MQTKKKKKKGSALRQGDAGGTDLQQHQPQHQCPEGRSTTFICPVRPLSCPASSLKLTVVPQIFKIVLSKAFDLKCTIPEITNVGEPLLIYQSC